MVPSLSTREKEMNRTTREANRLSCAGDRQGENSPAGRMGRRWSVGSSDGGGKQIVVTFSLSCPTSQTLRMAAVAAGRLYRPPASRIARARLVFFCLRVRYHVRSQGQRRVRHTS